MEVNFNEKEVVVLRSILKSELKKVDVALSISSDEEDDASFMHYMRTRKTNILALLRKVEDDGL